MVAIVDATFIFVCLDRLTFDEICGMFIFYVQRQYRRNQADTLKLGITPTYFIEKIHSGFLHPSDVVGVVDDTHFVCFVIMNFVFVICHLVLMDNIHFFILSGLQSKDGIVGTENTPAIDGRVFTLI